MVALNNYSFKICYYTNRYRYKKKVKDYFKSGIKILYKSVIL